MALLGEAEREVGAEKARSACHKVLHSGRRLYTVTPGRVAQKLRDGVRCGHPRHIKMPLASGFGAGGSVVSPRR